MPKWCTAGPCLGLLLALLSCGDETPTTAGPDTGSVEGVLTEIESGEAVGDARVALLEPATLRSTSASTATDNTGRYRIEGVPPGDYALVVFHRNLVIFGQPGSFLQVRAGQVAWHDLHLQNAWFGNWTVPKISGTVLDANSGEPIPGAHVGNTDMAAVDIEAPFFGTTLPYMGVTDEVGRFTLLSRRLFYDGEYYAPPINVTKSGYEPFTLVGRGPGAPPFGTMIPSPDSVLNVEIRLRPALTQAWHGVVRGRLLFAGQPVSGVPVGLSLTVVAAPDTLSSTAKKAGDDVIATPLPDRTAVSDLDGTFEIDRIPFGTYMVIAAYLANDGYVAGWMRNVDHPLVTLTSSVPVEVGNLELAKALQPLNPHDGSISSEPSPEIRWEPLTGLPENHTLVDYILNIDDEYWLGVVVRTKEPRWQVPVRIRPQAHMRWHVKALVVQSGSADTLILGATERAATFTVASLLAVTVSPGTNPAFSWAPPDPVSWLAVEATNGADRWTITSDDTNAIVPPVRYGEVPQGARELGAPLALSAGTPYVLTIARESDAGPELLAIERFTP